MKSQTALTETTKDPSIIQDRLNWKLAWRDDIKVAQGLYAGEAIDEMHELSDAGLLDEFFVFLQDMGMLQAFEQVSLPEVKRILVLTVQCVLLYLLKVLIGGQSMNELPRVLFSDLGLMELVGFNAQQCENGMTKRGDAQRSTKKKQGLSALSAWPITSANSPRKRWSASSTRWCTCSRDGECSAVSSWLPWMEVNSPRPRAMRGAGSSSKPAR